MTIRCDGYVPFLKWRLGEYQALLRLSDNAKDRITPLLMIPPIEFDFEEQQDKKTVQEHIENFIPRYMAKWGNRKSLIDMHETLADKLMDNGDHVLSYIFSGLRNHGCKAIPVFGFSKPDIYKKKIKEIALKDSNGVCLRVNLSEISNSDFNDSVSKSCSYLEMDLSEIDLILDLGEPENFEPYSAFSNVVLDRVTRIRRLSDFRSFVIAGMSLQLPKINNPGGEVPRHEWNLYKNLIGKMNDIRCPTYGDYTIEPPKYINLDMRMLAPSGKIVYTCDDTWLVRKGTSFQKNRLQMIDHCKTIINSGKYSGKDFSFGDDRIYSTGNLNDGCGNLSTWKQVGVNHHLEKVADQLSSFHGP